MVLFPLVGCTVTTRGRPRLGAAALSAWIWRTFHNNFTTSKSFAVYLCARLSKNIATTAVASMYVYYYVLYISINYFILPQSIMQMTNSELPAVSALFPPAKLWKMAEGSE